jgi:hypothetical protein
MSEESSKLQTPNPKKTPSSKFQETRLIQRGVFAACGLGFGALLEFGIWDLGFF